MFEIENKYNMNVKYFNSNYTLILNKTNIDQFVIKNIAILP